VTAPPGRLRTRLHFSHRSSSVPPSTPKRNLFGNRRHRAYDGHMSTLARPAGKVAWLLGAAAIGVLAWGLRRLWAHDPDLARLLTAPPDDEPVSVEDVVCGTRVHETLSGR
jgi:hypothetical protein